LPADKIVILSEAQRSRRTRHPVSIRNKPDGFQPPIAFALAFLSVIPPGNLLLLLPSYLFLAISYFPD